jgi:hypothetical protein
MLFSSFVDDSARGLPRVYPRTAAGAYQKVRTFNIQTDCQKYVPFARKSLMIENIIWRTTLCNFGEDF